MLPHFKLANMLTDVLVWPFCDLISWPRHQFTAKFLLCLVLCLILQFHLSQFFCFLFCFCFNLETPIFPGTCLSSLLDQDLHFTSLPQSRSGCLPDGAFSTFSAARVLLLRPVFQFRPLILEGHL